MTQAIDRRSFMRGASVLMGHAAFPQVAAAFLAEAGAPPPGTGLLSEDERAMVKVLVDLILPETDSPAASAANTHQFVDRALAACASDQAKATMRAGLADLRAAGFTGLGGDAQRALLRRRAEADMAKEYDASFFKILKDYTLTGYFHSEIGATRALAYERVPGGYLGDVPLQAGQKAWATS